MKTHDSMIKFMENLKDGNYPFYSRPNKKKKDKLDYILKFRSSKTHFCLAVSIICFLVFLFCCIFYDYKSKINTLFLVPFIVFLSLSIKYGTFHELQILPGESDEYRWEYKKYFFCFLQVEISNPDLTQLYIRIMKAKGFKKQNRYYLVIGGNGISPIPISSGTYNLDLIRSIGQKMSSISSIGQKTSTISSIKLNFFDVEDFPRYHNIVLSPPAKKS